MKVSELHMQSFGDFATRLGKKKEEEELRRYVER